MKKFYIELVTGKKFIEGTDIYNALSNAGYSKNAMFSTVITWGEIK